MRRICILLVAANVGLFAWPSGSHSAPEQLADARGCCKKDTEGGDRCCVSCGFWSCLNKPPCCENDDCPAGGGDTCIAIE